MNVSAKWKNPSQSLKGHWRILCFRKSSKKNCYRTQTIDSRAFFRVLTVEQHFALFKTSIFVKISTYTTTFCHPFWVIPKPTRLQLYDGFESLRAQITRFFRCSITIVRTRQQTNRHDTLCLFKSSRISKNDNISYNIDMVIFITRIFPKKILKIFCFRRNLNKNRIKLMVRFTCSWKMTLC